MDLYRSWENRHYHKAAVQYNGHRYALRTDNADDSLHSAFHHSIDANHHRVHNLPHNHPVPLYVIRGLNTHALDRGEITRNLNRIPGVAMIVQNDEMAAAESAKSNDSYCEEIEVLTDAYYYDLYVYKYNSKRASK